MWPVFFLPIVVGKPMTMRHNMTFGDKDVSTFLHRLIIPYN